MKKCKVLEKKNQKMCFSKIGQYLFKEDRLNID
jgi:hypothetical protein